MTPSEIHAQEAAKTYRVTFYRAGSDEPAKVKEFTGLALSTVQLKVDEWRGWTGGTAEIDVVTGEPVLYAARYGRQIGNGQTAVYTTEPWEYRPMAERDARWKLSDGWGFAEVVTI